MRLLTRSLVLGMLVTAAFAVIHVPIDLLAAQDTLPAGFGSLRRDDIAIQLKTDQVALQLLPLRESVIRLLAPDTYRALVSLISMRRTAIDSVARQAGEQHPLLVLVTFFGLVSEGHFFPETVNLASGGQLYRPEGIVPLSPRWSSYQLNTQEQMIAIYLFDEQVRLDQDLVVSYGTQSSDAWSRSVRLLDQERARVMARAGSRPN